MSLDLAILADRLALYGWALAWTIALYYQMVCGYPWRVLTPFWIAGWVLVFLSADLWTDNGATILGLRLLAFLLAIAAMAWGAWHLHQSDIEGDVDDALDDLLPPRNHQ